MTVNGVDGVGFFERFSKATLSTPAMETPDSSWLKLVFGPYSIHPLLGMRRLAMPFDKCNPRGYLIGRHEDKLPLCDGSTRYGRPGLQGRRPGNVHHAGRQR